MQLHEYMKATRSAWQAFQSSDPETADTIRGLVLATCGDMAGGTPQERIASMLDSEKYPELKDLVDKHYQVLGLRETTEREVALWIKVICFTEISAIHGSH